MIDARTCRTHFYVQREIDGEIEYRPWCRSHDSIHPDEGHLLYDESAPEKVEVEKITCVRCLHLWARYLGAVAGSLENICRNHLPLVEGIAAKEAEGK